MTRLSQAFLPTLKDPPADAEALSHKLMVRAGLIRQLGAGLWTYLPAGWRVERKVEAILREEMERIGCQEMLMPVLQPAEPWKKTGRWAIEELFKLEDRKGAEMVLAMTHEECVTFHVAREVRSYRDLPLMLFQIQTKERDEPRPRAGVLRTREFTMKDAYSFDRDEEGLARSYELQSEAYGRIFDRCGLRWYRVESDVGMMGGSGAHEYMAPCAAGENEVALAPGYAANVEVASAEPRPVELPAPLDAPEEVSTPGLTTVEEVSGALGVAAGALIKAMPVVVEGRGRSWSCSAATTGSTRSSCATLSAPTSARPAPRRSRPSWGRSGSSARSARTCRCSRTRRSLATPTSPGRTAPTPTCAASGPVATSSSSRSTCARSRPATRRREAARSRSSRRSRSATSSSSAPATRSRSAPPTSTRRGAKD